MSAVTVSRLAEQEAVIERGVASFVEVGTALMRIRNEELYREAGFEGFVEYLESKSWGLHPSRAYQLIDSAEVSTTVEIENEAQARELAPLLRKATPDMVREVYAEVVEETGGRPTAKLIRTKVRELLPSTRREPKAYYGKGDKWAASTRPLVRYLAGWRNRGFEFRHLNPREAAKRVEVIDALIAELHDARTDLVSRATPARLRV